MKLKVAILLLVLALTSACKVKVKGNMETFNREDGAQMVVKTDDDGTFALPASKFKMKLVVNTKTGDNSYLEFTVRKGSKKISAEVPLKLPKVDDLLISTDPVKIEAAKLGQGFGMMFMRTIKPGKDLYTVTFHDEAFDKMLGKMTFYYEPEKQLYDENRQEFLASYQKVKRKHRAVIMKIDSQMDEMVDAEGKWHGKVFDHIVNYGGAILISPWLWARYSSIKWLIGDLEDGEEESKWESAIADYPVIDYMSFVHSGDQDNINLANTALKKNQLRAMYTGACFSDGSSEWVEKFGAIAAAGHFGINAGPIWDLPAVRKWSYGYNFETAMLKAWDQGRRRAKILEYVTFAPLWSPKSGSFLDWDSVDDMISGSEIGVSYTEEFPAKHLRINQSAIRSKEIGEGNQIIEKRITEIQAEVNSEVYIPAN